MIDSSIIAILIVVITVILFVSQIIPLALASLIGVMLMLITGLLTPNEVCASFGSYICVLLACSSIIGAAAFEVGLAGKLGDLICKCEFLIHSEKLFLAAIILISGVMSMFVANIPVVALFIPIISAVAARSNGRISKRNLIMPLGFAATMGGNGTLIGSATNMAGQASLQETTGDSLGMFTMMPATVLFLGVMVVYYLTVGYSLEKRVLNFPDIADIDSDCQTIPFQPVKAIIVGAAFVGMMVGFLTGIWNFGVVSMIAAIFVILTGCISLKTSLEKADWNTVIIVGSSLVMASAMNSSGAGMLLANAILKLFGGETASPVLMLCVTTVTASLLSCLMQNGAVVSVMIPIFCTIASVLHVNPVTFAVAIVCGCNICYATPISTAPVMMTLAGGYRFNDYVKVGGLLLVLTNIIAVIGLPLLYPL